MSILIEHQVRRISRAIGLIGRTAPNIGDPQEVAMRCVADALEDLVALADDVRAMREQAIANQNWYTFVTCEYGEGVDESLAKVFGWPLNEHGMLNNSDVPPLPADEGELIAVTCVAGGLGGDE